jgi:general secretion pathway protein G
MRTRAGFTLIELLVVVFIITILATIVGVKLAGAPHKARVAVAVAQIKNFKSSLRLYKMQHGAVPTQAQGLKALCEKPVLPPVPDQYPDDGYMDSRNLPLDPWDRDYVYLVPGPDGSEFDIISYGADGEPGGEDENVDIRCSDM